MKSISATEPYYSIIPAASISSAFSADRNSCVTYILVRYGIELQEVICVAT